MVNNSIGVDSNSSSSASLDHITELLSGSMTAVKLVAGWLVVEPPWVELAILRPLVREDTLLRRENFDSHPAHLTESRAFSLDISVGPAKHFKDSAFLSALVFASLWNVSSLPDKVEGLKSNSPRFSIFICRFNLDRQVG
jgi:hypothetical protein